MTGITSTISQPSSIPPQQQGRTPDKSTAQNQGGVAGGQESLQATMADIQSKRLELLLSVQTESKTTFTLQAGVQDQAASQGVDLSQFQYNGKPLTDMTQGEAAGLVASDGYFGVDKTSQRLADFVINGGGDDLKKLQAGREGIVKGFKDAEQAWGQKLPDISYQTLDKALKLIDTRIQQLGGGSVVDVQA
jgi:hypothetical protein